MKKLLSYLQTIIATDGNVVAIAVAISGVLVASHWQYTTDDTYIYAQFAKNLLAGHGMAFNAGEQTYGFTSPLWLFLMAGMRLCGFDLIMGSKILGMAFTLAATAIMLPVAKICLKKRETAIALAFAWAANAWELRWAACGLETPMVVFLVLTAILIYYTEKNAGRFRYTGIILGVAALARPELALLLPLVLIDVLANIPHKSISLFFRIILPAACIVLPWWALAEYSFHSIIPNTALAKAGFDFSLRACVASATKIGAIICATNVLEAALCLGFLCMLLRNSWNMRLFFLISWVVFLPLLFIATDAEVHSRYLLAIIPVIMIIGWSVFEKIAVVQRRYKKWLLIFTVFVIAQNQYVLWNIINPHTRIFMQAMENTLIPIAQWIKENTPADAEIAAPDIGVLAYISDRKILDLFGLTTPAMRKFSDSSMHAKVRYRLFLSAGKPDYVIDGHSSQQDSLLVYATPPQYSLVKNWKVPILNIEGNGDETYYTIYKLQY